MKIAQEQREFQEISPRAKRAKKITGTELIVLPLQKSQLYKKSLCDYVINIASGCSHACTFCYVPSTPAIRTRQRELEAKGIENPQLDWGTYLFIREGIPAKLEETLRRKRIWDESLSGKGVVLLCSGTDPYQNSATAKVTREAVEVLLKYSRRVRILTRSPLWVNDLDLLVNPLVTVGMSLPHLDDDLSRAVEPGAPRPSDRLKALTKGKEAGCRIYLAVAPTVPFYRWIDFYKYFHAVGHLDPEVVFWEPINARGSNGVRMLAAGLDWASQVANQQQWAANFVNQWQEILRAATDIGWAERMHIWVDRELLKVKVSSLDMEALCTPWFSRPTREIWPSVAGQSLTANRKNNV